MKIKGWDIGLLFLILLVFTIGIRIYYVNGLMDDAVIGEDIYNRIYLNVIFQTFTVILLFWYLYYTTKKYYCFRFSMLLAVFPAYIHKISTANYYNMLLFLVAVLIVIVLLAKRMIISLIEKKKKNIGNEEVLEVDNNVYTDTSMKEIVMADFEDKDKHVKLLDNPLPVPKRKEHKEMDFAIELTPDNDDFDIKELPEGDDFDI